MRRSVMGLLAAVLLAGTQASAGDPVLVVTDTNGTAARVAAPVSVDVDLASLFGKAASPERLQLVEITDSGASNKAAVPVLPVSFID